MSNDRLRRGANSARSAHRRERLLVAVIEPLERRSLLTAFFTVTNLSDSGAGSLRDAITSADMQFDNATINFAAGVTGTIEVSTPLPQLNRIITINGPGANLLAVNGQGLVSNIFEVINGTATISGLTVTGVDNTLSSNVITSAILNAGTCTVTGCVITGNKNEAGPGGGIANLSNLTISGSTISGNSASTVGGGIWTSIQGTATVTNCTISNNTAGTFGGGVSVFKSATLTGCTFSGNVAPSGADVDNYVADTQISNCSFSGGKATTFGGSIQTYGATLELDNSTISGSSAPQGGAINQVLGSTAITNSTLAGNSATGIGGAIADSNGTLTVTDSTIVGNSAAPGGGGGIQFISSGQTIDGSIIAGNTGSDLSPGGNVFQGSNDLIGDGSDAGVLTNSRRGTGLAPLDPMLGTLSDNGGGILTMLPLPGSPAIGNGAVFNLNSSPIAVDERDHPRPTLLGIDIGAAQEFGGGSAQAEIFLASSTSAPDPGQPFSLTAEIIAATPGPLPTGTITFFDGGVAIGSAPIQSDGTATQAVSYLLPGTHTITATYNGDANFSTINALLPLSSVVTPIAATETFESSQVVPTVGQAVSLTLSVVPALSTSPVPTGTVTFISDGVPIGTAPLQSDGSAAFSLNSLSVGSHQLSATYSGDEFYAPVSVAPISETVGPSLPLQLVLSGVIPPFAIAGQKTLIHQKAALISSGEALNTNISGTLYLDKTTSIDSNAVSLGQVLFKTIHVGAAKQAIENIQYAVLPPTVPPSTYHLLLYMTDIAGDAAVAVSQQTIAIESPVIDLSGSVFSVPSAAKLGQKISSAIIVTNAGNIAAVGPLRIEIELSTSTALDPGAPVVRTISPQISLRAGQSRRIQISGIVMPSAAGFYHLIILIDPANAFNDVNTANNEFASVQQVAVGQS